MTHAELKDHIQRLQQSTDKITSWLAELDDRASEIDLFFQKGNLLQAAIDAKEAYVVITELAKQLFPTEAGALYLRNTSQMEDRMEPVAAWPVAPREKNGFTIGDCWALKSGKPHLVSADSPGPICNHVHSSAKSSYLCVPMIAHGEALGVLHLRNGGQGRDEGNGQKARLSEAKQRLAIALAGHIALSIANLRLRDMLSNQATRDPLTGLYNRRYLDEILERELLRAKRGERNGVVG